MTTILTIV